MLLISGKILEIHYWMVNGDYSGDSAPPFRRKRRHLIPVLRMPVILPYGAETSWLKASNHLHEILVKLVQYPSEKMNAHPISSDIDKANDVTKEMLKPIGTKLVSEDRPLSFPRSHYVSKKKPTDPGKLWFEGK